MMPWRTVVSLAALVGTVALVGVGGGLAGLWQAIDHWILVRVQAAASIRPDPGIRIIDVPHPPEARRDGDPGPLRERLGSLLDEIATAQDLPRVVVIDLWFSANPAGIDALLPGIRALRSRGVRVYAAVNVLGRHGAPEGDPLGTHHATLYQQVVDGYGHSQLEHALGVLKYRREFPIALRAGDRIVGATSLYALPLVATLDPVRLASQAASIVVPLGDDSAFAGRTLQWPGAHPGGSLATFLRGASHVIIGSLGEDSDNALARPGPLLLAWAMSERMAARDDQAPIPLNDPSASVALAMGAAAVSWLLLSSGFAIVRGRVAPPRWPVLLAGLALATITIAVALLMGVQALILAGNIIIPTAWPAASVLVGAGFAFVSARRWILDAASRRAARDDAEERAVAYDVFVSYAHDPEENRTWVRGNIVAPLANLRHADGRPYRVFFDERSIEPGRQWKREVELALLGSRCFIAVYSDRYFDRPYCREELELADQLRIEGRLGLVPVARTTAGIPERFLRKLQYLDATQDRDIRASLTAQVRAQVEVGGRAPGPAERSAE